MKTKTILNTVLTKALETKRPHPSKTNTRFTAWLASIVPPHLAASVFTDGAGNLHVDARTVDSHRTLFVAHVDTVHRSEGKNAIRKTKTHWHAKGDVLGADDGAGVAILMHMMHYGIKAYYIFTQGEERGGVGARYLASKEESLLQEFDRAIAFDRRGTDSVITHQGWGRCCSDEFGTALATALMGDSDALMYLNDDTGVYTDTAEFVDVIPECTNISVGYAKEHTQDESLDLRHFKQLAEAVLCVEWDALPVARDPSYVEPNEFTAGSWWTDYKTYSTYDTSATSVNDIDYRREEALDAVLDAQYGYTEGLAWMIADSVYPEDAPMAVKHMNFKQIDLRTYDDAIEWLEHGEDIDAVLGSLFDELHTA